MVGHVTAYKLKEECCLSRSCLVYSGRRLLFMIEQVFAHGEVWRCINAVQKAGLKLSIQKSKIMVSGLIISCQIDGGKVEI